MVARVEGALIDGSSICWLQVDSRPGNGDNPKAKQSAGVPGESSLLSKILPDLLRVRGVSMPTLPDTTLLWGLCAHAGTNLSGPVRAGESQRIKLKQRSPFPGRPPCANTDGSMLDLGGICERRVQDPLSSLTALCRLPHVTAGSWATPAGGPDTPQSGNRLKRGRRPDHDSANRMCDWHGAEAVWSFWKFSGSSAVGPWCAIHPDKSPRGCIADQ